MQKDWTLDRCLQADSSFSKMPNKENRTNPGAQIRVPGQSIQSEKLLSHVTIRLLVDTGSFLWILPEDIYQKRFHQYKLQPSTAPLIDYLGKGIPVLGKFDSPVQLAQRQGNCTFNMVRKGMTIMALRTSDIQLNFASPTGGQVAAVSANDLLETVKSLLTLFYEVLGHAK